MSSSEGQWEDKGVEHTLNSSELPPPPPTTTTGHDDTIRKTITRPGTVKINVEGAFIVDESPPTPLLAPLDAEDGSARPTQDIRLPHHTAVVSHVAVDIGGTLAKLVYFSREPQERGGRLTFHKWETERIEECLVFINGLKRRALEAGTGVAELRVVATGGGAYKYYERMKEVLGVSVQREDEMECLIIGLDFFITEIPLEVFTFTDEPSQSSEPINFVHSPPPNPYPYLLVNIGSGVSMIKVSGPRDFLRVGGTSLGGGTFWGLLSLLTGAATFDSMLAMADRGDNATVDLLVGDIYGTDYSKIGLKSSLIGSSFGKVFKQKYLAENLAEDGQASGPSSAEESSTPRSFAPEDISKSLLFAISNNIGQIAYLQSEKHGLENIYFGGSFIRGHKQTIATLSYAIRFWSQGAKKAYFLRHEGYLGATGAFLKMQKRGWGRKGSMDGEDWVRAEHDD